MKKYFQPFMNLFASGYVVIMHSKITFSIARKCDNDWFIIKVATP